MFSNRMTSRFVKLLWLLAPLLALLGTTTLGAQSAPPEEKPREQTIYIPFEDLVKVFEKDGRGVYLPYDQFQKLWNEAQAAKSQKPPTQPMQSLLVSAENQATIQKDLMVVESKLRIDLTGKGWHRVPLQLQQSAILSAFIDGNPAKIVAENGGYTLLFEKTTDETQSLSLEIRYARGISKKPGQNSVEFQPPQAPINRWNIRIPEPGVQVQVSPAMASTQSVSEDLKSTELAVFLGTAPTINIAWVPKSETALGMSALANAQLNQIISVEEGLVRTNTKVLVAIERSEMTSLSFEIPKDQKIVNVFDANVKQWLVESNDSTPESIQILRVELYEPEKTLQTLTIESESILSNEASQTLVTPSFKCVETIRQSGLLEVRVAQGLKLDVTERTGLTQADLGEFPRDWAVQPTSHLFRYNSVPFSLKTKLEKVDPTLRALQRIEVIAEPDQLSVELSAQINIERVGVFQLEFDIPDSYELLQVQSSPTRDGAGIEIDRFERSKSSPTRWIVSLRRRTMGVVGLWLQLRKPWGAIDLRNPTDKPFELDLDLPRVAGAELQWLDGWCAIFTPPSIRASITELNNARVNVNPEYRTPWTGTCRDRYPSVNEAISFAHSMEPAKAKISIERRKPFATHQQFLSAFVDTGAVRYVSTHFIKVQYSPITKWRLDIPSNLALDIRVETPGVRESVISPPPQDLAEGYVAWEFASETPWIQDREVRLVWQSRIDALDVGKTTSLSPPRFLAKGMDLSFGQVILHKREGIDLENIKVLEGLRTLDPRYDLFPEMRNRSLSKDVNDPKTAAKAFEYQGDWSLSVDATRFALQSISTTNIERAYIRAVATRSKQVSVVATYRMKNARQRIAVKLPDDIQFDSQPLRINGAVASLEQGEPGLFFLPMSGADPSQSVLVVLSYNAMVSPSKIPLPVFPDEPSIQKVYLELALPKEWTAIGSSNQWNEEYRLVPGNNWQYFPSPVADSSRLETWVAESLPVAGVNRPRQMVTNEQVYLFSSIRPGKDQDSHFGIMTMSSRWLAAIVLGACLVLAVVFWRYGIRTKLIVISIVVSCLLSLGFFYPMLAQQLVNAPLAVGGIGVGLLWTSQGIGRWWESRRLTRPIRSVTPPRPEEVPSVPIGSQSETGDESNLNHDSNKHDSNKGEN